MLIKVIFVWNLVFFIFIVIVIKIILCISYLFRKVVIFVKKNILGSVDYSVFKWWFLVVD